MDSKVCVNCENKKPVNGTDNRLVTESCGHVKCMQCLLQETSGCKACEANSTDPEPVNGKGEVKKTKLNISHIKIETDGTKKKYTCTVCSRKFSSRSQIIYHAYCNGAKKPYECPHDECQKKSFATLFHYNYHMRVHNGEHTYQCDVCNAKFVLKSKLQRHKLKHTKDKKCQCTECGKAFFNGSALRKHMRLHNGECPYTCEQCGRRFRDSSNYKKHLRKHKDRQCLCKSCDRGGGGGGGGGRHEARRHRCPHCPQAFHERKDARRHLLVHSENKAWSCGQCGRRFRRKDNLERHARNSHANLPLSLVSTAGGTPATNGTDSAEQHTALPITNPEQKLPCNVIPEDIKDKASLQILNPLPPLSNEVIQKHLYESENKKSETVIDKSYIIEANNARESVIVGNNANANFDRKSSNPVTEYVHKIRKANSLCQKDVTLPPIDAKKFMELTSKHDKQELDVGPLPKNIQTYKNILHDRIGEKVPEVHWRKKRLTDNE